MTSRPIIGLIRSLDQVPPLWRNRWPLAVAAVGLPVALYSLLAAVPAYAVAALLFQLMASPAIVLGMTRHGQQLKPAWMLIACAEAVLPMLSMLILAGHSLEPAPILHAAYMSGYVLLAVGMALMTMGADPEGDLSGLLDALIVAIGFLFIVYFLVIDPGFESGQTSGSQSALVISLVYPGIDTWLLAMAVRLIFDRGRLLPWHVLMLGAVAAPLVSDVLRTAAMANGTYAAGQPSDVVVALGSLLWAAAALHPSAREEGHQARRGRRSVSRLRLILIALAIFIAPVILVVSAASAGKDLFSVENDQLEVAGGAIVLSGLVIIRLFGALSRLDKSLNSRDQLQDELKRQALRDGLTGLPNRVLFGQRLDLALARNRDETALLFCDLDDFKTVNDTLGHTLGDELLVAVAQRLKASLRPTDLAARLGGDEFGVLLEHVSDANSATRVAERLVDAFREPIFLAGQTYAVRVSIGIALGSAAADGAELMRNADIAMYLAKSQGKGRYELFHPGMQTSVVNRLALRASLERAIEEQEFVLNYQPIHALSSDRIEGVEALVRWDHPDRGRISPGEFIPLAEQVGLIVPLGRWVLRTACRQLGEWLDAGAPMRLSMSVNVSPVQLAEPGFVDEVGDAIVATGIPARNLVLELTEGALIDAETALRVLTDLKRLGVRLAVDDFGTGYSAMSYLGRFPIDILKIDRSFVSAIGRDDREAMLLPTIIRLAGTLELDTVAEGIEDESQLDTLRQLGCEFGQGFLLGRPLDAAVVTDMVTSTETPARPTQAA